MKTLSPPLLYVSLPVVWSIYRSSWQQFWRRTRDVCCLLNRQWSMQYQLWFLTIGHSKLTILSPTMGEFRWKIRKDWFNLPKSKSRHCPLLLNQSFRALILSGLWNYWMFCSFPPIPEHSWDSLWSRVCILGFQSHVSNHQCCNVTHTWLHTSLFD